MFTGRGVPNQLRASKQNPFIPEDHVPTATEAAALYQQEPGTRLTDPAPFAPSPFPSAEHKQQSDTAFAQLVPDLSSLLDAAINRDYTQFQNALLALMDIAHHHCTYSWKKSINTCTLYIFGNNTWTKCGVYSCHWF